MAQNSFLAYAFKILFYTNRKTMALKTNKKVPWFHSMLDSTLAGLPSAGFFPLLLKSGFAPVFEQKIQGLFKDFQGHISHISKSLNSMSFFSSSTP